MTSSIEPAFWTHKNDVIISLLWVNNAYNSTYYMNIVCLKNCTDTQKSTRIEYMKPLPALTLLGLSKKERKVLQALRDGSDTVLEVHRATKISRTAIYHIVSVLKARGLLESSRKNGRPSIRVPDDRTLSKMLYETKKELLAFPIGTDEVESGDTQVIFHRGVEAMKTCFMKAFTENSNSRFTGLQGTNDVSQWEKTFGVEYINTINRMIKKNSLISEGIVAEGWFKACFNSFGPDWINDYLGRMGSVHCIPKEYFNHAADIYIFNTAVYLICVEDHFIIEIRHPDIAKAITQLITYVMDTTHPVDYSRIVKQLHEAHIKTKRTSDTEME